MKKYILPLLALSILAAPAAAQAGDFRHGRGTPDRAITLKTEHPFGRVEMDRKHIVQKKTIRHKEFKKARWSKGQHVQGWQRKSVVNDWKRNHLHTPPRGHQWVRIGNDFLLIRINGGIIASFVIR